MRRATVAIRSPEATRRKILEAAMVEFYENGFQAGSLNHIVDLAGITKGALFHHFESKQELGYAVLDEIIGPVLLARWLEPVRDADDPLGDIQRAFRQHLAFDIESGNYIYGCPLNNLAQEMSPLDEGFHTRINRLYATWRERYEMALERGIRAGTVKPRVMPRRVAALIVASQMGIWGTGKSSRDPELMREATDGLCDYLERMRIQNRDPNFFEQDIPTSRNLKKV